MRSTWGNRKALYFVILLVFVICIVVMTTAEKADIHRNYYRIHNLLADSIKNRLELEKPLPTKFSNQVSAITTCVYVLGGNQDSLIHRFRKASILYKKGLSRNILILSRPGITEFNRGMGRNLTNNEWAIKELELLNVRKEDVEPVSVEVGIFGTLSEGKDLTSIVRRKGCNRLILVTSDLHTRRAFIAFTRYSTKYSPEIYVYGAEDPIGLMGLFAEYIKLLLYDHIAIPLNSL